MAKITYYLGAGASYYACPILEKQAKMMIAVANFELRQKTSTGSFETKYKFIDNELKTLPDNNRIKILWHIGFFGKKALEFNTVDTFARKLELSGSKQELNLLKMSVSVFFDLWENFYLERYSHFTLESKTNSKYKNIDQRYISLMSVLLNRENEQLKLNDSFKFISWNYDLQVESAFQSFLRKDEIVNLENLNDSHFPFMENIKQGNCVYHLNGHRGFFDDVEKDNIKRFEININKSYEKYWNQIHWLYESTISENANFHKYLKYAWEHNLDSPWFKQISRVLEFTEVLVIVGYSFPPFNREIDQFLFSQLHRNRVKKIIYQDPNANTQIIENLFKDPRFFKNKIQVEKENLNQFYIPNEHFITQDRAKFGSSKLL